MNYFVLVVAVFVALSAVSSADGDAGVYIPKAFYTLDASGHKTALHPVSPHILRRLRRESYSSSSSSASSSASANGGPAYFSNLQSVHASPGVGFASRFGEDDSLHPAASYGSTSTSVSSNGGPVYFTKSETVHQSPPAGVASFSSRFGEDSSSDSKPVFGKTVQTTGFIDEKGVVHAKTSTINH